MTIAPPLSTNFASVFDDFPDDVRACHHMIREMIYTLAEDLDAGPIDETLKWGQPAYLNTKRKIGTTLRLGWSEKKPGMAGIYVHCQTTLVRDFQNRHDTELEFDGSRGMFVPSIGVLPSGPITAFLSQALTYHRNKTTHG